MHANVINRVKSKDGENGPGGLPEYKSIRRRTNYGINLKPFNANILALHLHISTITMQRSLFIRRRISFTNNLAVIYLRRQYKHYTATMPGL